MLSVWVRGTQWAWLPSILWSWCTIFKGPCCETFTSRPGDCRGQPTAELTDVFCDFPFTPLLYITTFHFFILWSINKNTQRYAMPCESAMGKRESAMGKRESESDLLDHRIRYGKWEYAMPNANTLWENANQKVTFSATIGLTLP